jgi:hypothetical protein
MNYFSLFQVCMMLRGLRLLAAYDSRSLIGAYASVLDADPKFAEIISDIEQTFSDLMAQGGHVKSIMHSLPSPLLIVATFNRIPLTEIEEMLRDLEQERKRLDALDPNYYLAVRTLLRTVRQNRGLQ